MPTRNSSKPPPSERAQRIAAGVAWGVVAFCGITALAMFIGLPIWFWAIVTVLTVGLTVWGMDRKNRLDQLDQLRQRDE